MSPDRHVLASRGCHLLVFATMRTRTRKAAQKVGGTIGHCHGRVGRRSPLQKKLNEPAASESGVSRDCDPFILMRTVGLAGATGSTSLWQGVSDAVLCTHLSTGDPECSGTRTALYLCERVSQPSNAGWHEARGMKVREPLRALHSFIPKTTAI